MCGALGEVLRPASLRVVGFRKRLMYASISGWPKQPHGIGLAMRGLRLNDAESWSIVQPVPSFADRLQSGVIISSAQPASSTPPDRTVIRT